MFYYIGDVSISDELYHHGIKGQKWGVRRYQNTDGTYTALGKLQKAASRAGVTTSKAMRATGRAVTAAGRATGKAVGVLAKHEIDKIKRKHLWMMNENELAEYSRRLAQEKSVKDAIKSNSYSRGKELARGILERGAQTLANKAFESLGNSIVAKNKLADDIKREDALAKRKLANDKAYNKAMSKRAAKDKIKIDKKIDRAYRRQTYNDPSSILAREVKRDYKNMTYSEIADAAKRYGELKKIENRFRGAQIKQPNKGSGN